MAIFGRSWRLSIQINDTLKTYQEIDKSDESLKIDFSVKSALDGEFTNGDLTISGLKLSDTAFLGTNYDNKTGELRQSELKLEAGYPNATAEILLGNIIEATPNFNSPNNEINLKIKSGGFNNIDFSVCDSFNGATNFKTICEKVAQNNKVALEFKTSENPIIQDYSFKGTPFQQIENLRKYVKSNIFLQNAKLCVFSENQSPYTITKIDYKSGLIGSPKPNPQGCEITCLLNPNLQVGQFIELETLKIPQLNGNYRIIELTHFGSNRGADWFSNLVLTKAN